MKKIILLLLISVSLFSLPSCSEKAVESMIKKGLEKATNVDENKIKIDHGDTSDIDKSLKDMELLKSIKIKNEYLDKDYVIEAEKRVAVLGVIEKVKVYKKGKSYRYERESEDSIMKIYNSNDDTTYEWYPEEKTGYKYSGKNGDFTISSDLPIDFEEARKNETQEKSLENLVDTLKSGGINLRAQVIEKYGGDLIEISLNAKDIENINESEGRMVMLISPNYAIPVGFYLSVQDSKLFNFMITKFDTNPSIDDAKFQKPTGIDFE